MMVLGRWQGHVMWTMTENGGDYHCPTSHIYNIIYVSYEKKSYYYPINNQIGLISKEPSYTFL